MIRLIIKGTRRQALQAARERGIDITPKPTRIKGETVATAGVEDYPSVALWFAEPIEAKPGEGFPPGSLLFYGEVG